MTNYTRNPRRSRFYEPTACADSSQSQPRCPRPQTRKLKVVPARKRVRAPRPLEYETFPVFARITNVLYFAAVMLIICLGYMHQCQESTQLPQRRQLPEQMYQKVITPPAPAPTKKAESPPADKGIWRGWIWKRGHVRKSWTKRYFVLSDHKKDLLAYYSDVKLQDRKGYLKPSEIKDIRTLTSNEVRWRAIEYMGGYNGEHGLISTMPGLSLKTPTLLSTREWQFAFESEVDLNDFKNTLRETKSKIRQEIELTQSWNHLCDTLVQGPQVKDY